MGIPKIKDIRFLVECMECGKKFRTTEAAQDASSDGCPECGGVDIDVDVAAS